MRLNCRNIPNLPAHSLVLKQQENERWGQTLMEVQTPGLKDTAKWRVKGQANSLTPFPIPV